MKWVCVSVVQRLLADQIDPICARSTYVVRPVNKVRTGVRGVDEQYSPYISSRTVEVDSLLKEFKSADVVRNMMLRKES